MKQVSNFFKVGGFRAYEDPIQIEYTACSAACSFVFFCMEVFFIIDVTLNPASLPAPIVVAMYIACSFTLLIFSMIILTRSADVGLRAISIAIHLTASISMSWLRPLKLLAHVSVYVGLIACSLIGLPAVFHFLFQGVYVFFVAWSVHSNQWYWSDGVYLIGTAWSLTGLVMFSRNIFLSMQVQVALPKELCNAFDEFKLQKAAHLLNENPRADLEFLRRLVKKFLLLTAFVPSYLITTPIEEEENVENGVTSNDCFTRAMQRQGVVVVFRCRAISDRVLSTTLASAQGLIGELLFLIETPIHNHGGAIHSITANAEIICLFPSVKKALEACVIADSLFTSRRIHQRLCQMYGLEESVSVDLRSAVVRDETGVCGVFGAVTRFRTASMLGPTMEDCVKLAKLNEVLETRCLLLEKDLSYLDRDTFGARLVDVIACPHVNFRRRTNLGVYEVILVPTADPEMYDLFTSGTHALHEGSYDMAADIFMRIVDGNPHDRAAKRAQSIAFYLSKHPGSGAPSLRPWSYPPFGVHLYERMAMAFAQSEQIPSPLISLFTPPQS